MCTTMIHNIKDDVEWVYKYYPSFRHLNDISVQSSEGLNGRKETLFDHHIDSKLERRNIKHVSFLW